MADLFDEAEIYGTKQEVAHRNYRAGFWLGYLAGLFCSVLVGVVVIAAYQRAPQDCVSMIEKNRMASHD